MNGGRAREGHPLPRERWEVREPLGRGAMAEVFSARRDGENGVLKRVRADHAANPAFVVLMENEAEALRRVRHDAVIRLLDAGPGWLVVERAGPLQGADGVVERVLEALVAAHAVGVLHRDCKLANVLLTARGPVLADWGAARVEGRPDPAPALGTPRAMAPERLRGEPASPASDVWSVGALAWELATGRPPFDEDRWGALLARHSAGLPTLGIPGEDWMRALLHPDPARRPTASEALAALSNVRCGNRA